MISSMPTNAVGSFSVSAARRSASLMAFRNNAEAVRIADRAGWR
jgi:hypothetical protein